MHFVAVGSAPILKKSKFLIGEEDEFGVATAFLRRLLRLDSGSSSVTNLAGNTTSSVGGASLGNTSPMIPAPSLFLYINAAFVPSPDERIGDLYDCFGVRGELVIHYSLQEAWG